MVVTLAVIAVLACVCTFSWLSSQKNHVIDSYKKAVDARELVFSCADERFNYAKVLLEKIGDPVHTQYAWEAVDGYSHETLVSSYDALDASLLPLQKAVFDRSDYASLAPYFSKLSEIEDELEKLVGDYNEKARISEYYRTRNKNVAEKNGVSRLNGFDLSSALRNRP